MKVEELYVDPQVCNFCHPNHEEEIAELTSHLLTKNGYWIGGYTPAKSKEYNEIRKKFEEGKKVQCFCVCHETGQYICGKHLLELAQRML